MTARRFSIELAGLLFVFSAIIPAVHAQTPANPDATNTAPAQTNSKHAQPGVAYTPPTEEQRFHSYLFDAYGPYSFLRAGFIAGINQANNTPPDWGGGAAGFGSRFGSAFGESAVDATTVYALGSLLREDTRYYRCDCKGFGRRLKHALLSTVTARRGEDGHYVLSASKLAGPYAGGMATLLWYPARFGPKDGFRAGNYALVGSAAVNVVREFVWPGI